jgi:hypothetical protein
MHRPTPSLIRRFSDFAGLVFALALLATMPIRDAQSPELNDRLAFLQVAQTD